MNKVNIQELHVSFIGTIAALWTASNHAYLGMTAYWVDPTYLRQKSLAFACAWVRITTEDETLTSKIVTILTTYQISKKVF